MYRFFPTVFWRKGYPNRNEIVDQVTKVWETYGLKSKTKFDTKVNSVKEDDNGRWLINNDISYGKFDGIVAAIGSCGDPKVPHIPGQEKFKGEIYHSSELDGKDVKDKTVLIIGGGASAIEAMEFTTKGKAKKAKILSRVRLISQYLLINSLTFPIVRKVDHSQKPCHRYAAGVQHLWTRDHLLLDSGKPVASFLLP